MLTKHGHVLTYDCYLKNSVRTPEAFTSPFPHRLGAKSRFLGPTLNFDRTYVCNGTWYQQSESSMSIYSNSPTCLWSSSVVCWSVCLSVYHLVSPAKTAKAIEMRFALRTRVGPRNHLLDIAERFQPNTVLWAFHTIQPSDYDYYYSIILRRFQDVVRHWSKIANFLYNKRIWRWRC